MALVSVTLLRVVLSVPLHKMQSMKLIACAELEEQAIAALLQESESMQQPKRAPKAGRRAVKRLELIDPIDAQTLERLGGAGTECSICRYTVKPVSFCCADFHTLEHDF